MKKSKRVTLKKNSGVITINENNQIIKTNILFKYPVGKFIEPEKLLQDGFEIIKSNTTFRSI